MMRLLTSTTGTNLLSVESPNLQMELYAGNVGKTPGYIGFRTIYSFRLRLEVLESIPKDKGGSVFNSFSMTNIFLGKSLPLKC